MYYYIQFNNYIFFYKYLFLSDSNFFDGGSIKIRLAQYANALDLIFLNPFFGVGYNNSLIYIGNNYYEIHNLFLYLISLYGLIPVFFFLFFSKNFYFSFFKHNNNYSSSFLVSKLTLMVMLVSSLFSIILNSTNIIFFILYILIYINLSKDYSKNG